MLQRCAVVAECLLQPESGVAGTVTSTRIKGDLQQSLALQPLLFQLWSWHVDTESNKYQRYPLLFPMEWRVWQRQKQLSHYWRNWMHMMMCRSALIQRKSEQERVRWETEDTQCAGDHSLSTTRTMASVKHSETYLALSFSRSTEWTFSNCALVVILDGEFYCQKSTDSR